MSFSGTFEYALDAKNRLTVPAKHRAAFAAGAVIALPPPLDEGQVRTVALWPAEEYKDFAANTLKGLNPYSNKARRLQQRLYGNSWECELDSANRLLIPPEAREYAGLTKDVVISGAKDFLEVWDKTAHAAYNPALLADSTELVDDSADFD